MNIETIYSEIIDKLKNQKRPQIKLNDELVNEIKEKWEKLLTTYHPDNNNEIKKILCILDNTQSTSLIYLDLILKSFEKIKDKEMVIYLLSVSKKHIVDESLKIGKMIPESYLNKLKELIKDKNPEINEWALRTVEALGPLSLRFKNEILSAKPSVFKIFSKQKKINDQIIEEIKSNWKRFQR